LAPEEALQESLPLGASGVAAPEPILPRSRFGDDAAVQGPVPASRVVMAVIDLLDDLEFDDDIQQAG